MDILTRPKRKRRVIAEPHDNYSFYLPVSVAEQVRRSAERRGRSYSEVMTEAMQLYLAVNIHTVHVDTRTDE